MPTVLIVTSAFPPVVRSGVFRTAKFVKHLPEYGWNPVVLVVHEHRSSPTDAELLAEIPDGTVVERVSDHGLRHLGSIAAALTGRPVLRGDWGRFKTAARLGEELCARHDVAVIYLSFPPDRLPALGLRLEKSATLPLVTDFRDPPWQLNEEWHPPRREREWFEREIAPRVYRRSARLIANTEPVKDAMVSRLGIDAARIVCIPNGYDEDDFTEVDVPPRGPRLRALSAGKFRPGPELDVFIDGLARAADEPGFAEAFRLEIVGRIGGPMESALARRGIESLVTARPHVSHRSIVREMQQSDLNVVFVPKRTSELRASQKLYQYLRAGRPILAIVGEGPGRALLREFGVGIVADPLDAGAIADALVRAYREWKNGEPPPVLGSDPGRYERKHLTGMLARVFDEVAGGTS